MIDQRLIKSGYHIEFLMTPEYIRNMLMTLFETGTLPIWSINEIKENNSEVVIRTDAVILHPPMDLPAKRLYEVNELFSGNEHPYLNIIPTVYSDHDDELTVEILTGSDADIRVKLYPSYLMNVDESPSALINGNYNIFIDVTFRLGYNTRPDGLIDDISINIDLVDISGQLVDAVVALPSANVTKEGLISRLSELINKSIAFPLTSGGAIQAIETKKFVNEENRPDAIGFYMNLALQDGPEIDSILEMQVDIALAENFLPAESIMAFAFHSNLYNHLGKDFKFKLARLSDDGSGEYYYPIVQDGEKKGSIKDITVYPEKIFVNNVISYTNTLIINIYGEYDLGQTHPDFNLKISIRPYMKAGLLNFDVDYDLDISIVTKILLVFLGAFISVVLPQLGIPIAIVSLLAMKVGEEILVDQARESIEAKIGRASFLDSFPNKLPIEAHRWDPLFYTEHRLWAADARYAINDLGFCMDARDTRLGRTTTPIQHMVIRSEIRGATGTLSGLYYRARDLRNYLQTDLISIHAATLRLPYIEILPPETDIESYRVGLSLSQIEDRIEFGNVIVTKIEYIPKKVDIIDHQIFKILALSSLELPEIESTASQYLRTEIVEERGDEITALAISTLENELGRTPTEEEISTRYNILLADLIRANLYSRNLIELDRRMKFQLEPFEFASLQRKSILILGKDQLVIIDMNVHGKVITYYRDFEFPFDPGASPNDNLMNLPKYKSSEI